MVPRATKTNRSVERCNQTALLAGSESPPFEERDNGASRRQGKDNQVSRFLRLGHSRERVVTLLSENCKFSALPRWGQSDNGRAGRLAGGMPRQRLEGRRSDLNATSAWAFKAARAESSRAGADGR